ncbi:DUF417 family protein [Pyruvatibacter sp.]|uniref:DUF417 family protein n=1 Tax=Pyruvatibacter sp. TaxID=1981328 RepID=UPI00326594A5
MTTSFNSNSPRGIDAPLAPWRVALSVIADKGAYVALGIIFLWFGGMKFTTYEAEAIQGLVASSPFTSFLYGLLSVQGVSSLIGSVEIIVAVLLLARFVSPKLSLVGAAGAVATFLVTFSFFFSTPGVFLADVGGPAISVLPGQFLLKDLVLLVVSLWAVHDSLVAVEGGQH